MAFVIFQLACCTKNETHMYSCLKGCNTCYRMCEDGLLAIKDAVGGVGLFFSFTLVSTYNLLK